MAYPQRASLARHPVQWRRHTLAVLLFGNPFLKCLRVVWRSSGGEAAIVEAKFERALTNLFFQ